MKSLCAAMTVSRSSFWQLIKTVCWHRCRLLAGMLQIFSFPACCCLGGACKFRLPPVSYENLFAAQIRQYLPKPSKCLLKKNAREAIHALGTMRIKITTLYSITSIKINYSSALSSNCKDAWGLLHNGSRGWGGTVLQVGDP